MQSSVSETVKLVDLTASPEARAPLGVRLSRKLVAVVRRVLGHFGLTIGTSTRWNALLREVADLKAYRESAAPEIAGLKEELLAANDQRRVQQDYIHTLRALYLEAPNSPHQAASTATSGTNGKVIWRNAAAPGKVPEPGYSSCRWIEGGLSFVPGHVRVCPNCNASGGAPGLMTFPEGRLPVDDILVKKEIIRQGNSVDRFDPCANCAYRVQREWPEREYAFDILCISHATACNLACGYCHTIPGERYLQNPKLVAPLYGTIQALIADGHLAPDSLIQWGGGEPTILREFPALFQLLERHGAYSEVYTSGVRVSDTLLDGLERDTAGVMISLDAGTAETYTKIKGRAAFERVVANVRRYAQRNPGRTLLKMILFEQNLTEVSRFLDIAESTGVRIVCFDTPLYQDHVDDRFIDAAAAFCEGAEKRGLEWRPGEVGLVFNPDDRIAARVAERRRTAGALI